MPASHSLIPLIPTERPLGYRNSILVRRSNRCATTWSLPQNSEWICRAAMVRILMLVVLAVTSSLPSKPHYDDSIPTTSIYSNTTHLIHGHRSKKHWQHWISSSPTGKFAILAIPILLVGRLPKQSTLLKSWAPSVSSQHKITTT